MKLHVMTWYVTATALVLLAGCGLAAAPTRSARTALEPAQRACTSFCLDNDDQAVFGANYDNEIWKGMLFINKRGVTKTGWEAGTTGLYARWTAEYGSVTFNLAGAQMVWAGMNEAGLAISTMWLGETRDPTPDERPPLVSPIWIQYQLDTCGTLADVMANNARVRVADVVDHYLVCDRSGACAVVEFLEGKTVFHTGDAMPVKALTNDAYRLSAAAWQAGRLVGNSLQRFGIAADRAASFQPADTASAVIYAFDTLDQASGQATGGTPTQWSIVFDTANRRVYWRTSRNPQVRFVDFARLDLTCGSPVEMLDVHAPLSGDISDKLGRYTFAANLQSTLNFIQEWGGNDLSKLEVEVLERGVEAFGCEQPAAPYQEEKGRLLSPVVGWAARTLLYRYWPVLIAVGLGIAALVVWRARARSRRR